MQASLDGKNGFVVLHTVSSLFSIYITLDYESQSLYWLSTSEIGVLTNNGLIKRIVSHAETGFFFISLLNNNTLYFNTNANDQLFSVYLDNNTSNRLNNISNMHICQTVTNSKVVNGQRQLFEGLFGTSPMGGFR